MDTIAGMKRQVSDRNMAYAMYIDPPLGRMGMTVLGFQGDDVVQVVSYYMATGASYKLMKNALPIHPTISEFFPTVLNELKPLK